MRVAGTFLPPRTSTTSSVGIRTCPILSCRPNAAMRPSRLSFTLRSKPEYVWMMYHCFAMRSVSLCPVTLVLEHLQDSPDAKRRSGVDCPKKYSKNDGRHDDNER